MSFDIQRIRKSARRISKFLRKNSKRPSSETIHKLRTDARRLETALLTLEPDSKGRVKRLVDDLDDVRKRAGKVRDMDVLTADALELGHDNEQDCVVQLLEHLGSKRGTYVKKLRLVVDRYRKGLRRELKRASQQLEKVLEKADRDLSRSSPVATTAARALELGARLSRPVRLNRTNLHPYRLKVKELQNVLQLSRAAATEHIIDDLKEVKDAIGEWHDWEELHGIATRLIDHASCKVTKTLRTTSDSKFAHALRLSRRLSATYRRPQRLQRRKRARNKPVLPPTLLETTAALVQ
jgi:CHAD domain-containing protein